MMELLRRLALGAGMGLFAWFRLTTPAALYSLTAADFDKEYRAKYGPRESRLLGAAGIADRIIRETTDTGSAAAYRIRVTEGRLLETRADAGALLKSVDTGGTVWLSADAPALAPFLPGLDRSYARAHWLNAYLPVATPEGTRYLEFLRHNQPKDTAAPAESVYPMRGLAWPWLGAGLLLYLLLPGVASRPGEARADPVAIGVLDLGGMFFAGLFFAIPFFACDSTREVLGRVGGGTGLSWTVAAAIALLVLRNAAAASFRFRAAPGELRIRRLTGERVVPLGEIAAVEPLMHGPERTGAVIRLRTGAREEVDWTGLLDAETVVESCKPFERGG